MYQCTNFKFEVYGVISILQILVTQIVGDKHIHQTIHRLPCRAILVCPSFFEEGRGGITKCVRDTLIPLRQQSPNGPDLLTCLVIHGKMCNVRLLCVKHALNVCYKTYVKRMDRAQYVCYVCFYHTLYMRFEKHALNAWYEKHAFYHPLKSLMLTYYILCNKIVFLKTHVKRMFW